MHIPLEIRAFTQRPERFELNYGHPLAQKLVFAGMGELHDKVTYWDSGPYGFHGTHNNPASIGHAWFSGRRGLRQDGSTTDPRILLSTRELSLPQITICFWCAPDSNTFTGDFTCLAELGTYPTNSVFTGINIERLHYNSNGTTALNLNFVHDSQWKFCACRGTGTQTQVYVDGIWGDAVNAAAPYLVGAASNLLNRAANARTFDGGLADFCIYSEGLSDDTISEFDDPSNLMLSGLIKPSLRKFWSIPAPPTPTYPKSKILSSRMIRGVA